MYYKETVFGTIAYTAATFSMAVLWHILLFEEQYQLFGYIEGDPNFLLGFLTILIQGLILSMLFPYVNFKGTALARALKYAAVIGMFFWTSHVLAFVAKQVINSPLLFVVMESFYLLLQFGVYGLFIGFIFRKHFH